jgi:anion-transporting  ArsA/GET3 family ATPase
VIQDWLERKEVCICAGSGGVGKTTTSAAIALGMAARGKKVAVLTIDPARRLANALGLPELGNEERRVDVDVPGELWAMMLDAKRTFDELIEWHAPDEATRDAVLGNRIYQELSSAVAGSQEYMAMEKLHELHLDGRYDLLVLDTPPTRNALDFLDAPQRLSAFIDSRALSFFLAPSRFGLKVLGRGTGVVFSVMQRATGIDLLKDLSDFFQSFGGMTAGFRERADRVNALLRDHRSAFVLVTSPRRDAIEEARYFHRRLVESDMPFAGVVANRVHMGRAAGPPQGGELERLVGAELAGKVGEAAAVEAGLAERDRRNLAELKRKLHRKPLIEVPLLDADVHDLDGLRRMDAYLFDSEPAAQTGAE